MIQSTQKTIGLHWLLLACALLCATAVHAEDPLFEPLIKNDGTEASEENPKELKAEEDPNAPLEKDGGEPKIRLEDGEVVIDRGGAERVIDPDDASISPVERDADPDIEEVVIIGIQRALNSALEEKRQTTNLTEIINAENVGKLPDENVAEVLENIPGVQIERNGGIGSQVSIRGSDQNRVEIDGRGTVSDGEDRGGVRFADLPAALVRSLTVTKVPTADMIEGSIGGTINVKTYRGLKLKEPLVVGTFLGEYADNSGAWNQNYSSTMGDKFETPAGDMGAIFTVSYIAKDVREDRLRVSPAVRAGANGQPQDFPPAVLTPDGQFRPYFYPGFSDTEYLARERNNITTQGSLEWQAKDSFKIFAEGTYTHVNNADTNQTAFASYGDDASFDPRPPFEPSSRELNGLDEATFGYRQLGDFIVPVMTSGVIAGGQAEGRRTFTPNPTRYDDGLQIRPSSRYQRRNTDTYVAAIGGEWLDDDWLIEFEANASGSYSNTDQLNVNFQYNDPNSAFGTPASSVDFNSINARVRVPFEYRNFGNTLAFGPVAGTPRAANLLNPDYYSLYVARDTFTEFDNDLYAQRIDIERFVDNPFLTSINLGFRSSQRSTERTVTALTTDAFPGVAGPTLGNFLIPTPGDFFRFDPQGQYLSDFLTADGSQTDALREELESVAGLGTNDKLAPPQGFTVDEKTYAGYGRIDFDTDLMIWPVRGNLGVRFVHTDQTAFGSQLNDDQTFSPISVKQSYSNWLPSLSVIVAPVDKVQIRFGYASTMRRPDFAQLAPTFNYPLNGGQAVRIGNPDLQPSTIQQVDLGVEWYFRKGSVLSAGYFYKGLEQVIGQEFQSRGARPPPVGTAKYPIICNPIAVSDTPPDPALCPNGGVPVDQIRFVNQPGGRIQGFEVAFQHYFNYLPQPFRGLGIVANYAYQDGQRDATFTINPVWQNQGVPAQFPLNFRGLSEHSYNITVYYEKPKYGFSGRVRYTWRSGFLLQDASDVSNGGPLYRDARGQLNAQISYRLPGSWDHFTLLLWGVNLTKAITSETALFPTGPTVRVSDSDRRVSIGLRARW